MKYDLEAANKLARNKHQKAWLKALLSEEGLKLSEHVIYYPVVVHGLPDVVHIGGFVHLLRERGYVISFYRAQPDDEVAQRIVGRSDEDAKFYRLLSSVNSQVQVMGPFIAGSAPGSDGYWVTVIADMGPHAVELAQSICDGDWAGSTEDLADVVRSLI